ncbi:hypothetical protein ACFWWM_36230 [Streptomyces sp. NPDC058682]|uniref:hypothetical protein n=1 Tax=Streptomyces sp. NPDC058682 TaxID=3346596 RepID=UPI00365DEFF2
MTTLRDGICRAKGCRRPGRLAPVFRRADPGVDAPVVDGALREATAPPPSLAEGRVSELPGRPVSAEQLWFLLGLPPVRAGGTPLGPPRHDAAPSPRIRGLRVTAFPLSDRSDHSDENGDPR